MADKTRKENWEAKVQRASDEAFRKDQEGTLTIGEIFHPGFYRLTSGVHKGRVVILPLTAKIDGKRVGYFTEHLGWIWHYDIKDVLCTAVAPTFSK